MKILKKLTILFVAIVFFTACDGVRTDTDFGYSVATPEGFTSATPKNSFKLGFAPKSEKSAALISVKAQKIDDEFLNQVKESNRPEEELVNLINEKMASYLEGGAVVTNKALTGYEGCYMSSPADDNETPRADVYYIVVDDTAYIFVLSGKNNETVEKYQQSVLDMIGSIQIN